MRLAVLAPAFVCQGDVWNVSDVVDLVRRTAASADGKPALEGKQIKTYLHGVQGLRTVAALMVAVYHIWFHRVSGGVDVFFVVAGYFAAGSMLKAVSHRRVTERIKAVWQYWLRTVRRVVPSAVVVVLGTVAGGLLFLPRSQWEAAIQHGWASLTFRENWYLIEAGHDYLQQDLAASAFQQFWALAIQVQAYFLFPLVALLVGAVVARTRGSLRRLLFSTAAVLFAASLAFSIWLTSVDQTTAYFHLGTRFWEFLAGALMALFLRKQVASMWVLRVVGWIGLIGILGFAAFFDPSPHLPGWAAMVPVLSAAAVIVASRQGAEPSILRNPLVLKFADSSFAFYLWHWPLLVWYRWKVSEEVSLLGGLVIIFASAALAVVTTKAAEKPMREWPLLQRSTLATVISAALMLGCGAVVLTWWQLEDDARADSEVAALADALSSGVVPDGQIVPSVALARQDISAAYARECQQGTHGVEMIVCDWGASDSDITIMLVGYSKETQWIDALDLWSVGLGVSLKSITKGACPFGDVANAGYDLKPSCSEWNAQVLDHVLSNPPDLVITVVTRPVKGVEAIPEFKLSHLERLSEAGIPVLGIRENPRWGFDVPGCVEMNGPDGCTKPRSEVYVPLEELDIPTLPGFTFVDMADDFCDADTCHSVRDGVLSTWDRGHLTKTWTQLKGQRLREALTAKLAEL